MLLKNLQSKIYLGMALLLPCAAWADMAGGLLVSPTTFNFGEVALAQQSPLQYMTVTNTTAAAIGPLAVSNTNNTPFTNTGSTCPGATLAPGASCVLGHGFNPTALGVQATSGAMVTINGVQIPISMAGQGVLGLSASPTELEFGDVVVNTNSPLQYMTVTNTTSVAIGPLAVSNTNNAPFTNTGSTCPGATLAPGASCVLGHGFNPTGLGAQATSGALVTINGLQIPITMRGNGVSSIAAGSLLVTPAVLDFGDVPVGATSAPQAVMLTNITGAAIPINDTGGATPAGSKFNSVNGNCGPTLAAGASCQLGVYSFSPTAQGPQTDGATNTVNGILYPLAVQGNGVAGLKLTPATIDFGPTPVGSTSAPQSVTLSNVSSVAIPINDTGGATPAGSKFNSVNGNCGPTLAAGASCQLSVYSFSPTAQGPQTDGATNTVNTVLYPLDLKGMGTAAAPLAAPVITSATPPGGTAGTAYAPFTVTATGTAPITFSDGGTLPPGLVIDANSGAITGTPTGPGSFNVTITASNGVLPNAAQAFAMVIVPGVPGGPGGGVAAVPTLSEWGLLLLAGLLGGLGYGVQRQRQRRSA